MGPGWGGGCCLVSSWVARSPVKSMSSYWPSTRTEATASPISMNAARVSILPGIFPCVVVPLTPRSDDSKEIQDGLTICRFLCMYLHGVFGLGG